MLIKLDYKAKRQEVEDMIWEVDEDCDKCVSWDEFKLMFQRCRTDRVRACPRPTRGGGRGGMKELRAQACRALR